MRRFTLSALLALSTAHVLSAQPASAPWRTIDTAHFRVHFPAPFEAWARHAASTIEGIHERVTDFVGYRPGKPIDVLVEDPAAEANGMAYPFLDRPVIVLWTSPPEAESGIGEYGDWMQLVLTHEMAHIVHLTRPRNRPNLIERIIPLPIGPVLLNSPRWVAEGYATVVEGALTGSGRPHSSYRAMILRRFAIEGKLPSYGALSSTSGWLGGSMAYLVGSAYLEWLEEKEGKGSLVRLWKRMASRRGGDFHTAFKAIFGRPPNDLYDRFSAELTARAIEEERRLRAAGVVEGEPWQRLEGGTASPQVSPDGSKLLARRDPKRGESFVAVWAIEETEEERRALERRKRREEELLKDVNEVAEKVERPRPRAPGWRLPRTNGFAAENPRWMPDGRRVLFSRRAPDSDGVLHSDLYLWDVGGGGVTRVTHLADVSDADPESDGARAVAVRDRYGISNLTRVDLTTGEVRPITTPPSASEDPWLVWSHPRVSPDRRSVAALLHRAGRWRLALVSREGEVTELATEGVPFGPPAWSPDGTRLYVAADASGIWNLAELDPRGGSREITRVTGGALSPAPSPDGKSLFFLELTGKGVDVRRLALPPQAPAPLARSEEGFPVLPPSDVADERPPRLSEIPSPKPYSAFGTHVLRLASGFSLGPDGNSYQVGAEGSDVIGRFRWAALASVGNAAGPRGGSVAASWYGLPVALSLQLFSAMEKPGRQHLVSRSELDEERRGGFLGASWERFFPAGRLRLETGAGAARVEALASRRTFDRTLGGARAQGALRRTRGKYGFRVETGLSGSFGRTDGFSWSQLEGGGRLTGLLPSANVSLSGRYGATGGSPTRFDLFALGGSTCAILPDGLDRNRIESPALPAAAQLGERFEAYRAELSPSGFPLVLFAERMRAWNGSAARPDWIRLEGIELRLERLIPPDLTGPLSLYLGVARVRSREPRFDSTRGYAGLLFRP